MPPDRIVGKDNNMVAGNVSTKTQGGLVLPFLDKYAKGHDTTEWYHWKIDIQLLAKCVNMMTVDDEVGGKIKELLIKLQVIHGEDNINIFLERQPRLEAETFPKQAKEVKNLLVYKTSTGRQKM
eukprot:1375004-Ditylum_brightwellii.AAC.1